MVCKMQSLKSESSVNRLKNCLKITINNVKINNPINSLKVHSDLNVYESLKLLISSDILVCSNSSFSYVAHIISGSESYFSSDFRYKIYPNSRYYDDLGNILIWLPS